MKQQLSEIKRMQKLAGIINEDLTSNIKSDLEKVSGLGPILDPVKVKEVAKELVKTSKKINPDVFQKDINAFNKIAVYLANNKLSKAATTIASLGESFRLTIWGIMDEVYPELWNTLFQEKYHSDAKPTPKDNLPE
jgi:uncharacterized protein YjeT (DUF2065 family)